MQFQFRKMAALEGPLHIHDSVDVSRVVADRPDILSSSPLTVDLKAIYVDGDTVDVAGTVTGQLQMACSRCLKPINEQLDIEFHEQFKLVKGQNEPEDEEDYTIYVDQDVVELTPIIEEAFLLHLPLAPVCDSDCKGLCQKCGTDLNENTCSCDTEVIDPRLAGLKDFFNK